MFTPCLFLTNSSTVIYVMATGTFENFSSVKWSNMIIQNIEKIYGVIIIIKDYFRKQ